MIKRLWKIFVCVLVFIPIYILSVHIDLCNFYGGIPSTALLENPQPALASDLYTADGLLLGKFFRDNRSPVSYEELPKNLIQALLASEDIRFYEHSGIDLMGLFRAFFLSILLRKNKGGGSTLTQQLAKNLFHTRTDALYQGRYSSYPIIGKLSQKTKEWILAVKLERAYTKNEILAMYLNTVAFDGQTFGIKAASRVFFNKTPKELRVEESALLVGLLRAPTRYSPVNNPQNAHRIRNTVLSQMVKYHFLASSDYNLLCEMPIELEYQSENYVQGIAPYFRALVRNHLIQWAKSNGYDIFADGLRIYTTIDSRMQQHAEAVVSEHMKNLQRKFDKHWENQNPWINEAGEEIVDYIDQEIVKTDTYRNLVKKYGKDNQDAIQKVLNTPVEQEIFSWDGPIKTILTPLDKLRHDRRFLQSGFMAMDPRTGQVKAWVGGINYKYFQFDHVKQSKRQAGSTFKPIVYTVAIDNDYSPHHLVVDEPVTFTEANGNVWTPQNAWKTYSGKKYTLRHAMAQSYNSITAYLIKKLTPQLVVDYAKRMGITGPLDPVPSICLGSSDVSVYEMVSAYSTYLNHGIWTEPFFIIRIEDQYGNIIHEFTPQKHEAIHKDTAALMTYMLQGSLEEGALNRVSQALTKDNDIAGKSGTTSNHSDGWFIGLSTNLCVGVWVGGDSRCIHFRDFELGNGSVTARPIWEKFLLKLYNDPQLDYHKGPLTDKSTWSQRVKDIIEQKKTKTDTLDIDIQSIY